MNCSSRRTHNSCPPRVSTCLHAARHARMAEIKIARKYGVLVCESDRGRVTSTNSSGTDLGL